MNDSSKGESLDEEEIEWEVIHDGRPKRRITPYQKRMIERAKDMPTPEQRDKLFESIQAAKHDRDEAEKQRLANLTPEQLIEQQELEAKWAQIWADIAEKRKQLLQEKQSDNEQQAERSKERG